MRNEFPDAPIFQDPDYLSKYLTVWKWIECIASELLDGHSSAYIVPWIFICCCSLCICSSWTLEKRPQGMGSSGHAMGVCFVQVFLDLAS